MKSQRHWTCLFCGNPVNPHNEKIKRRQENGKKLLVNKINYCSIYCTKAMQPFRKRIEMLYKDPHYKAIIEIILLQLIMRKPAEPLRTMLNNYVIGELITVK